MNAEAILALMSDLYVQIATLRQENAALRQQLVEHEQHAAASAS